MVIYPIAEGSRPDRRLTNWAVGGISATLDPAAAPPGLVVAGPQRRADAPRERFPHSRLDPALIEATHGILGISDVRPEQLPRWRRPRHAPGRRRAPDVPVGSTGASQAILDARFLADRLKDADNPVHACGFMANPPPVTAEVVRMNRTGGPEGVIDVVEARAPDGFRNIDDVLSFEQRKAIVRGYASLPALPASRSTKPRRF